MGASVNTLIHVNSHTQHTSKALALRSNRGSGGALLREWLPIQGLSEAVTLGGINGWWRRMCPSDRSLFMAVTCLGLRFYFIFVMHRKLACRYTGCWHVRARIWRSCGQCGPLFRNGYPQTPKSWCRSPKIV